MSDKTIKNGSETVKNGNTAGDVKQRLLDAGEELFAELGFDGTSARCLTAKADCNLAAINYHFGGKYELYLEVIRRRMSSLRDRRIEKINAIIKAKGEQLTLEELLKAFAESFVEPLVKEAGGQRFVRLISWEMLCPKFPREEFVREMINTILFIMTGALKKLCPNLTADSAIQSIISIVAQLLHCVQIGRAFGEVKGQSIVSFSTEQRVEHIVKFSAAAIRGLNESGK